MFHYNLFCYILLFCAASIECFRKFPENFSFGVSTASYQIEGGWNIDGKSENIWDHMTHTRPELIDDRSNGDIACDSYRLYKRDVEMIKELGVDSYRFSLSWTRLCPSGFCNKVNQAGVTYYNNLINELIANNIRPVATLYHWDLPQRLQDIGGWANPLMEDYFEDYARACFEEFGDRVKEWLTFNEPKDICLLGYGKKYRAPSLNFEGIADYLCTGTLLRSHARAYRLYQKDFKPKQKGRVGLTLSTHWFEPADMTPESIKSAEILRDFEIGLYADPIFSSTGDYPQNVRDTIQQKCMEQKYSTLRLRPLTPAEIENIRGSADFFGINHYTTKLTEMYPPEKELEVPSFDDDHRIKFYQVSKWPGASADWLKVVPWGFRKLLNWIKDKYNNPEVIIFENGYADLGEVNDTKRVAYLREYLGAMLDAIENGCNVSGYMVWTLMDNFEWRAGYTEIYGLYKVDFNHPNRTRIPKDSAKFYSNVVKNRGL